MHAKSIGLAWIVVKDFKKAVKFYTENVGLKLIEKNEEWGWAELEGHEGEGMRLGIAQQSPENQDPIQPGQNAVITFTVDNIDHATKEMQKKGSSIVGQVQIVPGHVKIQSVRDPEGNLFQLVELIEAHDHAHEHKGGCCCH